jgi:DNA-binding response OmpR family regulator
MPKTTILIVEDDDALRAALESALTDAGFLVRAASSKAEALSPLAHSPTLALVDLNLPDGDGFSLCKTIKESGGIPVIFLTVRDDEADIVRGLDMGGDDYITKPFRLPVLLSRIRAVLRRSGGGEPGDMLRCGNIRLSRSSTEVTVDNVAVPLTAGEYRLLLTLLEHKNQTLTRTRLLERLWDEEGNFVNDNTLTVTMKRLREKIEQNPAAPRFLKTVRGIGYKAVDANDEA